MGAPGWPTCYLKQEDHPCIAAVRLFAAGTGVAHCRHLGVRRLQETDGSVHAHAARNLVHNGSVRVSLTEATAQHKNDFGNTPYWEVVVIGEGRTTGTESISPNTMGDSGMFATKDDISQEVELPQSARMGEGRGFERYRFTPGL